MTAHEFARYLQAYCDGELEPSKMLEVEGHLDACPSCRSVVEGERAFREGLRAAVAREPVPPHLVERLRSAIAESEESEGRPARPAVWGRRAWSLALAASILLFVVGGTLGYLVAQPSSRPGFHPLVTDLVSEHMKFALRENPAELPSENIKQVAHWVRGRLGYSVRVPDYSTSGIQLLGARVARLSGRRAGYIVYEKGRNIISLFAFPRYGADFSGLTEIRRDGRSFLSGEYQGQQILLWESGKTTYALVSDVGWDEIFQCARVFFQTAQS
ncbi:MAG: anti-sigma factor family protein [Candidatus Methylomirabilales bacterium]